MYIFYFPHFNGFVAFILLASFYASLYIPIENALKGKFLHKTFVDEDG